MADPVSLTLGIIPLVIAAISAFSSLQTKLKTLRQHRKEVKQVRRRFRIQGDWFRDELHLLLLKVLDHGTVASMMEDENHYMWQRKDLETKLRSYLGTKYDSFHKTIDEARETIEGLLRNLSAFAPPEKEVSLLRSIRDRFRIAFRKQEYGESLAALKESNEELRKLREMASELKKCRTGRDQLLLPSGYGPTQAMSAPLHDLLRNRSSCDAAMYSYHSIKLLLLSEDELEPHIDLIFEHQLRLDRALLPIHAKWKGLGYGMPMSPTPETNPGTYLDGNAAPKQQHGCDVHHDQLCGTTQFITPPDDPCQSDGEDLSLTRFKCEDLFLNSVVTCSDSPAYPLGYMDIRGNQRLVLYRGFHGSRVNCDRLISRKPAPVDEFFEFPSYDVVSDTDRLKLGITLVRSMLKHHSTPWWPQEWALGQVHVFREDDGDLSSSLDTLHLSVKFDTIASTEHANPAPTPPDEEDLQMDILPPDLVQRAMEDHGIRNLTLFGTGVALLQIGLWDRVPWEDHVQVRRKVARLSYLGKRYRDATKRLIDCDFGLATEQLHDKKLQSAIFSAVVGDLESLLHELTSSGV